MELRFSGELQREAFGKAVAEALGRHPMLRAVVDDSRKWPLWVAADGADGSVDWAVAGEPIVDEDTRPVDLRTEAGLKVWVRVGQGTTRLRLRFQHACCDGLGALRFLEDLLILYDQQVGGKQNVASLIPLEARALKTRGEVGYLLGCDTAEYRMTFRDVCVTAGQWARFLSCRPAALAPARPAEEKRGDSGVGYASGVLSSEEINGLRKAAVASQVSINDLLLRDLFEVMSDWNRGEGRAERDRLRVNVPVSLRCREDKNLPAANRLSFAFLTRRQGECQDREQLLTTVHSEMETIRREHRSLGFLGGLAFVGGVGGLLPWFLKRNGSFATMVMSNLGRPFARTSLSSSEGRLISGGTELEEITGSAPIRPGTRGSIAVIRYANRLGVNLKCDPQFFSPAETERLLGEYLAKVRETGRRG